MREEETDFDQMTLDQIAKAHWTNQKATKSVAVLAREFLDLQAPGETFSTGALIRAMGGSMDQIKVVASHLSNARNNDLMPRYFDRGKKGAFGRESVLWHAHKPMTQAEKIAQIKRDQAEAKAHDLDDLYRES